MHVAAVKETARAWVQENRPHWPGLLAAHLVGGITAMPESAPFPPTKDVDIHLIFDEGSPALQANGSFANLIEVAYDGILIEAGQKPISEYATAAAVLANPEIAYHLTRDSLLYDPDGRLAALRAEVRAGYARHEWVSARIAHERRGHAAAVALRPIVAAMHGASAEWNILGYTTTFLTAALQVATLNPPRLGGRTLVNLREQLAAVGRLDLHEAVLAMLGVDRAQPEQAEDLLGQVEAAFDLAMAVKRSPHYFEHKLQAHLRPYFIDSCQGMIADGYHREAMTWAGACYAGCTDVILADAPEPDKRLYAARQAVFLHQLGMDSLAARDAKYAAAERLATEIFALAAALAAHHPDIVD